MAGNTSVLSVAQINNLIDKRISPLQIDISTLRRTVATLQHASRIYVIKTVALEDEVAALSAIVAAYTDIFLANGVKKSQVRSALLAHTTSLTAAQKKRVRNILPSA